MTEADGFPAAAVPTAAVPHQTCWVGLPTKGALSWPEASARALQVCQVLCPGSPAAPKGQHWGCDILMSAGSSWARVLHTLSNFCRSCCIFLLKIPGVFWIREGSWLGGTTGLQMRAAWACTLCPVSHHRSLPCPGIAIPGGSAVPRARPWWGATFVIAPFSQLQKSLEISPHLELISGSESWPI